VRIKLSKSGPGDGKPRKDTVSSCQVGGNTGTPRSHSLSAQKIGSATKPLREGLHGMLTHCVEIIGVLATFGILLRSAPRGQVIHLYQLTDRPAGHTAGSNPAGSLVAA